MPTVCGMQIPEPNFPSSFINYFFKHSSTVDDLKMLEKKTIIKKKKGKESPLPLKRAPVFSRLLTDCNRCRNSCLSLLVRMQLNAFAVLSCFMSFIFMVY